jgi:hypothetical protein
VDGGPVRATRRGRSVAFFLRFFETVRGGRRAEALGLRQAKPPKSEAEAAHSKVALPPPLISGYHHKVTVCQVYFSKTGHKSYFEEVQGPHLTSSVHRDLLCS